MPHDGPSDPNLQRIHSPSRYGIIGNVATNQPDMSLLGLMGPGQPPAGMDPTEYFLIQDEPYVLASDYTIIPQSQQTHLVVPQLAGTIEGGPDLLPLSSAPPAVQEPLPQQQQQQQQPTATSASAPSYKPHNSPPASTSSSRSPRRGRRPPTPVDAVDPGDEDSQVVMKRQKNTMAARKYRQKRLDRISDLERSLGDMTDQRDQLKLQLARREAEVEALREMLSRR